MRNFFLLLLFYLPLLVTKAQLSNDKDYFDIILSDAEIFLIDGASFYTYPLRMDGTEWITTAGVGIGTYLLVKNDDHIRSRIGTVVDKYDNNFWKGVESYGVVQYAEIAGAMTYAAGLFSKNNDIRVLGRMIVQSLSYSGLTAMFIRMIAGRKRPSLTADPLKFIGFTTNNSYQSFPSGHVTVAFAFSTVLAEYFDSPWSRIGFYGIAGLSATERLINSQHWFADVTLGALVGIAGGIHVINEESKRKKGNKSRLTIQPTFNGISFQYRLN